MARRRLKAAVVGYGPAFQMGRHHLSEMRDHAGFEPAAVCDKDAARLAAAREDFPGIATYTDVGEMLRKSDVDVVGVILPHNLHAPVAIRCLNAGKHVVVEKPMATSVAECDRMIAAAKKNKVMLSVYHNRHWDGNIRTIVKHLKEIGRPFRFEGFMGGYGAPGTWWRSYRQVSGGTIFDWGAHYIEWMLQVLPYDMSEIFGFGVDEVWEQGDTEDEVQAVVRFGDRAVGSYTESRVSAAGKDRIRICGTKGAITATFQSVTIHRVSPTGTKIEKSVPLVPRQWDAYYRNIGDHLYRGKPLIITPELGRRVVQVLDYASRSARLGRSLKARYR